MTVQSTKVRYLPTYREHLNPSKCSGVRQLHLKVLSAIQAQPAFSISDILVLGAER